METFRVVYLEKVDPVRAYPLKALVKMPFKIFEAAAGAALREAANTPPPKTDQSSDPELAATFARDAEKALARLTTIIESSFRRSDDIRQYVIDVHSMKSALADIKETGLSNAAQKLEQAGRAEDITVMTAETPAFLEALREVIKKSKPKEDAGEAPQEESDNDRAYLREKLLAIQTACEKYDVAAVNKTLAELGKNNWPRSVQKLLDTITEYLLNSDFEEAAKLVKDFYYK
jgi:HPt (histidine-containing phosphotransfer) domain-containing protein